MKALANIVKHDVTKILAFLHIFRVIYIDLIREKKDTNDETNMTLLKLLFLERTYPDRYHLLENSPKKARMLIG